jgi:DNA-binding GntR family transcriptional regulator
LRALDKIDSQPRRLADDVYRRLLDGIVHGAITQGDRLIQERLASDLDVSRTPVREALLRLEREGIVVQAGRKGFRVKQITPEMISGIYQAREAVEGYAARVVAFSAGPAQFDRLVQLLNRHDGVPTVESAYDANRLVHRAVVEATDNPYLVDLFDDIWGKGIALRIYADLWVTENVHRPLADDHRVLLEALRSGDGAGAEAAMVEHIRSALSLQLAALKGKSEADS